MACCLCQSPFVLTGFFRLISWQVLQELAEAPHAARAVSPPPPKKTTIASATIPKTTAIHTPRENTSFPLRRLCIREQELL